MAQVDSDKWSVMQSSDMRASTVHFNKLKNNTVQNAWYDTKLNVSFLFTCLIYFKLLKYYWFTVVFILFILIFLSVSGESQPKAIL